MPWKNVVPMFKGFQSKKTLDCHIFSGVARRQEFHFIGMHKLNPNQTQQHSGGLKTEQKYSFSKPHYRQIALISLFNRQITLIIAYLKGKLHWLAYLIGKLHSTYIKIALISLFNRQISLIALKENRSCSKGVFIAKDFIKKNIDFSLWGNHTTTYSCVHTIHYFFILAHYASTYHRLVGILKAFRWWNLAKSICNSIITIQFLYHFNSIEILQFFKIL